MHLSPRHRGGSVAYPTAKRTWVLGPQGAPALTRIPADAFSPQGFA